MATSHGYSRLYGVIHYLAVVEINGRRFRVMESGDPKYFLFDLLYPGTSCSCGIQFPVLKSRLSKEMRSALNHGWGNSH